MLGEDLGERGRAEGGKWGVGMGLVVFRKAAKKASAREKDRKKEHILKNEI